MPVHAPRLAPRAARHEPAQRADASYDGRRELLLDTLQEVTQRALDASRHPRATEGRDPARGALDWIFDQVESGALDEEDVAPYLPFVARGARRPDDERPASEDPSAVLGAIREDTCATRAARHLLGDGPEAEALATQLATLMPAFGIAPGTVAVQLDDQAAEIVRRSGHLGVAIEGCVYLDPHTFDPYSPLGREVLAHELAHVAQWQLGRSGQTAAAGPVGLQAAEIEAASLARVWVSGHVPTRPGVPLGAATPAGFAVLEALIDGFGDGLRERFADDVAAQLEGTAASGMAPVLRKWGRGELGISESEAEQAASDPGAAKKAARDVGDAGADLLVTGAKVTLFCLRALFGLLSKLRVLPLGFEHPVGPLTFRVCGGADFKTVAIWGRVEIDFAMLNALFAHVTEAIAVGEIPTFDRPASEDEAFRLLRNKRGKNEAAYDAERDLRVIFPWKAPLAAQLQLPPPVKNRWIDWRGAAVDLRGLHFDRPRIGLPSLGWLEWTQGPERSPLEQVWFEARALDIGPGGGLREVRTSEVDPDLTLVIGEHRIAGLEGVAIEGDIDMADEGAKLAARSKRAWMDLWGVSVSLGEAELSYSTADGPFARAAGGEFDLAGWAELQAEGIELSKDGLHVAHMRLPVPKTVMELLAFESVKWSIGPSGDGEPGASGTGIPQLALVWEGLRIGPDGFSLTPKLEPDLSQRGLSLQLGEVLRVNELKVSLSGLERWLASPDPKASTEELRFEMSADGVHGALELFDASAQVEGPHLAVSAAGFEGGADGAKLTLGALSATLGAFAFGRQGLSCASVEVALVLGGETLGPWFEALRSVPELEVSASIAEIAYRGETADWQTGPITLAFGEHEVEVPADLAAELLTLGFVGTVLKRLLSADDVAALARQAAATVADLARAEAAEVVQWAERFVMGWWQTIVSWAPESDAERPPAMGPQDIVASRVIGQRVLWSTMLTHVERMDDQRGESTSPAQASFALALQLLARGLLFQAITQLRQAAIGQRDARATAFFDAVLGGVAQAEAAQPGDTAPGPESHTPAAEADAGTTELGTQTSAGASARRMMVVDPDARLRDPKNLRKTLGADRSLPQGMHVEVIETLGTYVRVISAPGEVPVIDESAQAWTAAMNLGGLGADVGLGNERSDEESAAQSEAIRAALPPGRKPGQGGHGWRFGKSFALSLDGTSIDGELLDKVVRLCEWAAFNDMITDEIVIGSGMRSLANAHALCVSWEIQFGERVTLEALRALPDGKDRDGNLWYREGWTWEQIKANANAIRARTQDATASEGYPPGDPRRLPVDDTRDVSRHCSGGAIDVTIPWRVSGKDAGSNATDVWGWPEIYTQFGLRRPVSSEAWHVQATSTQLAPDPVPETTAETPADTGTRPTSTAAIEPGPSAPDSAPGDDVPTHQDEQQTYSAIAWDGIRRATNSAASWWYGEGEAHSSTPDHSTPLPAGEPTANLDESEPGTEASVGSEQADDAAYLNQVDNESPYSEGTAQCSPTSFTMQLIGVYQGDVEAVKARAREILDERGERSDYEQPEDLIIEILQTTDWDKACAEKPSFFWSPRTWAEWAAKKYQGKYYKDPNAQQYVASLFDAVGNTGEQTLSKCYTRKDWAPVIDALAKGALVSGQGAFTEDGHVVSIIAADDDGVVINDPFGLYVEGGYYLMNGHRPRVSLASSGLETLGRRARLRPDVVEAYHANEALPNWGQSNFYSWADVVAVQLGKWLSVLSRR